MLTRYTERIRFVTSIFCTVIFCLFTTPVQSMESYKTKTLKYGISVDLPMEWEILPKKLLRQLDNSTEAISGVNQSNNEILIAANCYTLHKKPSATFRVSVRKKDPTTTQEALANFTQEDLNELSYHAQKNALLMDKKIGTETIITSVKTDVKKTGSLLSLMTSKEFISTGILKKQVLCLIPVSYGIIKIQTTYNKDEERILAPITLKILSSVKIQQH